MSFYSFPNPVAVFGKSFVFTTISRRQYETLDDKSFFLHPHTKLPCRLFSLDKKMQYIPFAKDYGPYNQANTYQALQSIHQALNDASDESPVCLYSSTDPRIKANTALLVCLFFMVIGRCPPETAFHPIAEMEFRPFRDAGNGITDWGLSIQDCLTGVDKALRVGLLDFTKMNVEEYQYYETVPNGDLNLLGPFLPFASPVERSWMEEAIVEKTLEDGMKVYEVRDVIQAEVAELSHAFRCVLHVFRRENVGCVVRLNDELYDKRHFEQLGMDHVEMYFDDGSNPTDEIVRDFIHLAEEVICKRRQKIAVHCKAGLGRTGVLIGAYLIYKYGFTAQEVIGFMRIVRPGMVVGGQQQYLVENQLKWAGWAARDSLMKELGISPAPASSLPTPPLDGAFFSPKIEVPSPRAEKSRTPRISSRTTSVSYSSGHATATQSKSGDAVGQPRKTPRPTRGETYVEVHTPPREGIETAQTPSRAGMNAYRETNMLSSAPTTPGLESHRGIKRGSGRIPLPRTSSTGFITSPAASPPPDTVRASHSPDRPLSTISVQSNVSETDSRPSKKRTASSSSPSRVPVSSLSVPSSPSASSNSNSNSNLISEAGEIRLESSSTPRATRQVPSRSDNSQAYAGVTHPVTVLSRSRLPARKSFLPVKKQPASPTLKDSFPTVIMYDRPSSRTRSRSRSRSRGPSKDQEAIPIEPVPPLPSVLATPKRALLKDNQKDKRRGMTPPRFGFNILSRKGSNEV